ncbi:MAG: phosphatidate cytidylyltransferase [Candidatus Babeliales bacterium]|jgi:phosphatidate cytidylyltransferase
MIFIFSAEFFKRLLTSLAIIFCFGGAYLHSVAMFSLLMFIILVLVLFFEWPKLVDFDSPYSWIATVFYPIFPVLSLIFLNYRFHQVDLAIPMYPFLVAWTADTFGYFVGKIWGVHKIYPKISPGKSWEGFFGSFVAVVVLNFFLLPNIKIEPIYSYFCKVTILTVIVILLISLIFTIVAFLGGMLISILKRHNGLKDVGNVLPGHGGFLDRFDSVFFTGLLTWAFILCI